MPLSIKLRTGRFAIRGTLDPVSSNYTRQMRAQMKGIEANLKEVLSAIEEHSTGALDRILRPTFELSQKYVPVDTGALRDSGFLEVSNRSISGKSRVNATIGYGKGGKPSYTVFVHEMVEVPHKAPTRSKFLQAAIEEDLDNIRERVAEEYRIP